MADKKSKSTDQVAPSSKSAKAEAPAKSKPATTAKPNAAKPDTAKPAVAKTDATKPVPEKSATAKSTTAKPQSTARTPKPETVKSETPKPSAAKSTPAKSATAKPASTPKAPAKATPEKSPAPASSTANASATASAKSTTVASSPDKTVKKVKKKDGFWGNVRIVIEALAIALVIRTLLFQPFYIPSGSMKPSLLIGDYIIINKFSYGYSKFSCPFGLCPISGRIFGSEPERGDVVVFANPGDGPNHNVPYVKRLVGLPGDRIQVKESKLYVNGEAVPQAPLPDFAEPLTDYKVEQFCASQDEKYCYNQHFQETLPGGSEHPILNFGDDFQLDNTPEYTVPEGSYFMMGDNRDNSADSRADVGFVPAENLIGKANLIVFSSKGSSLFQFWKWRPDRFFEQVN